jgi:hypothetical protein
MSLIAPPEPPPFAYVDDDGRLSRVRFRIWQITWTAGTVAFTGWCCTLGWVPAIIALMIAKHVLVAVLMIGLQRDHMLQARQ